MDLIYQFGYLGLFLLAIFATTLFPISAEMPMIGMILMGYSKLGVVVVGTLGYTTGSFINYFVARKAGEFFLEKPRIKNDRYYKWSKKIYDRYGKYSLVLGTVPLIGDPIVMLAGVFQVEFRFFTPVIIIARIITGTIFYFLVAFPEFFG